VSAITATVALTLLAALLLTLWALAGIRLDVVRRRDEETGR
jgi:hypothetical protein